MINDLLKELEERTCHMIAYLDDVALVIKRKFQTTVYEPTEGYLNVVSKGRNSDSLKFSLFSTASRKTTYRRGICGREEGAGEETH